MFKKAVRAKVYLKLGIMGPSGSGKSYSALKLARGLVGPQGRIAAVDTENGSLSLYSDLTDFDVVDLQPPFEPKKILAVIDEAVAAGYGVLIIDSQTHFWKWILDKKESLDRQGGNSYTNWGKVKPDHTRLIEKILQSPIHIISCLRAKDEYVLEKNDKGKEAPRKVGMGAIAEPGSEYEFTVVFEVGMDHNATASKDRTSLFDGEFFRISEATGERLVDWLSTGAGETLQVLKGDEPVLGEPTEQDAKEAVRRWGMSDQATADLKEFLAGLGQRFTMALVLEALTEDAKNIRDAQAFSGWAQTKYGAPATDATDEADGQDEAATTEPEQRELTA
jgi:hypothetical protein